MEQKIFVYKNKSIFLKTGLYLESCILRICMTIMVILNHSSILPKKKINIILSGCWNIKSFSPLLNEFIHTFSNPSYVNTRIVLNSNFLLAYSNVLGKSKNLYENLFEKKNCKQCPRSKQ